MRGRAAQVQLQSRNVHRLTMIRKTAKERCRRTFSGYIPPTPACPPPTPAHKAIAPPWCRHTPLRCRLGVGTRTPPTPPRAASGRGSWPIGVGGVGRRRSRAYVGVSGGVGGARGTSAGWVGAAPTPPTPHRKSRRSGGARNSEEKIVKRTFECTLRRKAVQRQDVTAAPPYTPMGEVRS